MPLLATPEVKDDVREELNLLEMRSGTAGQFIELFVGQRRKVRELLLDLLDWPTPMLHRVVKRFTAHCGRNLNTFSCTFNMDDVPSPFASKQGLRR